MMISKQSYIFKTTNNNRTEHCYQHAHNLRTTDKEYTN